MDFIHILNWWMTLLIMVHLVLEIWKFSRQHNCPYCNEGESLDVKYGAKNWTADVYLNRLEFGHDADYASVKINYCPKCGRRVKETI